MMGMDIGSSYKHVFCFRFKKELVLPEYVPKKSTGILTIINLELSQMHKNKWAA